MSLDRFRHNHPQAYEYFRGKFGVNVQNGLRELRATLMRNIPSEPFVDCVVPLNSQISNLEQITRSARSDQPQVIMDYVSKLAEFKAKYQAPDTSPRKSVYGSTTIQVLSQKELDGKFLKLIDYKQLRKEETSYRKRLEKLTPEQLNQQEHMRQTVYKNDLVDAAKDVMRKSRKSLDAMEEEQQTVEPLDLSRLQSRSVMQLPKITRRLPMEDILRTCDQVLGKKRRIKSPVKT